MSEKASSCSAQTPIATAVPKAFIRNYVFSMRQRCQKIIGARGGLHVHHKGVAKYTHNYKYVHIWPNKYRKILSQF